MAYNILIVDDSSTIRKIITLCIKHAEVEVDKILEAEDGVSAVGRAMRAHTRTPGEEAEERHPHQ